MIWKFQKPWPKKHYHIGCLTCSTATHKLSMKRIPIVGFGMCQVLRDKDVVYEESIHEMDKWDWEYPPTAMIYEWRAQEDPDHDWRMVFVTPLHEETYQRQGPGCWVMIYSGPGFA